MAPSCHKWIFCSDDGILSWCAYSHSIRFEPLSFMLDWCHCVWWSINKPYKVWWYWTDGNQFLWYYVIIALVPLLPSYEQVTITAKNIGPITVFDYRRHIMGKKRNHIDLRFKETNNNILNIFKIKFLSCNCSRQNIKGRLYIWRFKLPH